MIKLILKAPSEKLAGAVDAYLQAKELERDGN